MSEVDTDVNALVGFLLSFAEKQLRDHGEFYPFGASMDPNGAISPAMADTGVTSPASAELISILHRQFADGARGGLHRATAIAYDVRTVVPTTGAKTDAVAIDFDHRDGTSIVIYFPYTMGRGTTTFGDHFILDGRSEVFPPR